MKKILSVWFVVCIFLVNGCVSEISTRTMEEEVSTIEIVDMAGRTVTVPKTIESVFGVNNNASIFLYTLVPDLMIGWNSSLSSKSEPYIESDVYNLPALGTLYGNSEQVNLETIIANDPDLIVFLQPNIDDDSIQAADALEEKLSIPVVMADGDFEQYDLAYRFMGELLGREEEAGELAEYCKETYELAESVKEFYSNESPVEIYYGSGEDGLSTVVTGSSQSYIIELLGALNVVDGQNISNAVISMEELMLLKPEIIILGNSGFSTGNLSENLSAAEGWNTLTAVSEGNVYTVPQLPFNWFDKPPSVNRILGVHWLAYVLHPEFEQEDIMSEIKEYFELFYHVEITDEAINKLIGKE